MVKLRLKRFGKKFQPHYRVIAIQARTKRDGRPLEELGFYNPMSKELKLKKDRIEHWLSVGAQPTETVNNLLIKDGIVSKPKAKKTFSDKPKRKSVERAEAKAEKEKEAKQAKEEAKAEKAEESAE